MGHLPPEASYLAFDHKKVEQARKLVMSDCKQKDMKKEQMSDIQATYNSDFEPIIWSVNLISIPVK